MIRISNKDKQLLEAGESMTFDELLQRSGSSERAKPNGSTVQLRGGGIWEINFSGNIASPEGVEASIAIELIGPDNSIIEETRMITSSKEFVNVGTCTNIQVGPMFPNYNAIRVVNAGDVPVTLHPNANLFIKRLA